MAAFKDRFRELRLEKGYTLKELGELLGYSESNLSLYESGKREPKSAEDFIKIAEFFDCTVDYLLGKSDFKKGRLLTKEELREFLPEEEIDAHDWGITVDDLNELSEETKAEIREVLRKAGYLKKS